MKRRVYLISGTGDYILPAKYTRPDFTIKGAGHFMVYANATEINSYIESKILHQT
ncbi:hypothetical protein [Pedobacter sp. MC2016-24]|uniref:hypothetical protein n=1 Tax=Pedobacter sp. MC2016-24 TaxID=2780090 RepID=UPI00187ECB82|nr:hypothetical protein [Pedobacter sp. MC2016-24]MBE9600023.1 hypothetical protein [Pedobacter sp. MC2016-24]